MQIELQDMRKRSHAWATMAVGMKKELVKVTMGVFLQCKFALILDRINPNAPGSALRGYSPQRVNTGYIIQWAAQRLLVFVCSFFCDVAFKIVEVDNGGQKGKQ